MNCWDTLKLDLHSVAGNGKRDGRRSIEMSSKAQWAISSQAPKAKAMGKVQRLSREGVGPKRARSAWQLINSLASTRLLWHKWEKLSPTEYTMAWSRKFSCCVECGRTDRSYGALGKCTYCYSKQYQADPSNVARVKEQKRKHYFASGGKHAAKLAREERWFGGNRELVLARDAHRCTRCPEDRLSLLVVHHEDGNGRGALTPNNSIENLVTLCRACHARHHSKADWSRKYSCCQDCGTTERRHNARGLCWKCYLERFPSKKMG